MPAATRRGAGVSGSSAAANGSAALSEAREGVDVHITRSRGGAKIVKPVSSARPERQRSSSASRARLETRRSRPASQTTRPAASKPTRPAPRQSPVKGTRSTALRRAASASRLQNSEQQPHSSASSTTGLLQPDWVDAKPHRPLSPRRERERQRRQEAAIAAAQARQSSRSRIPASRAAASGTRLHSIASQRAAALEAARQRPEHSFSPRITRKARQLDKQRSQSVDPARGAAAGAPAPQSRFHSLYDSAVAQRQRVADKARRLAQDPEATFKPAITAKARRLSRSASAEPSRSTGEDVTQAAGKRLYAAARSQQRNLEAKREAAARTPGTAFRPHLNRRSLAMVEGGSPAPSTPAKGTPGRRSTPGSKRKPLYDAQALKAAQARLEETRSKLELASCTFSPATNHNSKLSGRDGRPVPRASSRSSSRGRQQDASPAHERLLNAGKRAAAAREAKLAAAQEAEANQPFRPTLDTKSRALAERARKRQAAAIGAIAAARGPKADGVALSLSDADRAAGEQAAALAAAGLADEAVAATNGSKAAAQHAAVILGRGAAGSGDAASATPATAFDRLHSEQWLLQAKRHAAEEAAKSSAVQALAPKPAISAHSAELAAARQEGKASEPVWQRLYAEQWKDRSQIEAARAAQEEAKLAKCTFQPTLGPDSFAHTVGSAQGDGEEAPVWQRLYADSFHAREVDAQRLAAAEQRARLLSTAAPRRLHAMRQEFEAAAGHEVRSLADAEREKQQDSSIFDALHSHASARRESIQRQEHRNDREARRLSATVSPGGKYKHMLEQRTDKAQLLKERQRAQRRASYTHAVNATSMSAHHSVASTRSGSSAGRRRRLLHTPSQTAAVPVSPPPAQPAADSDSSDDSSIVDSQPSAEPRTLLQRSAAASPENDAQATANAPLAAITGVLGANSTPPHPPTDAMQQVSGAAAASHAKAAWEPVRSSAPGTPSATPSSTPVAQGRQRSASGTARSSRSSSRRPSSRSSSSSVGQGTVSPAGTSTRSSPSSASPLHQAAEPPPAPASVSKGSSKPLSPLAATALPSGRSISYGPHSSANSVGGVSTSAASASAALPNGPPPPLPPKRRKSTAPVSPASSSARSASGTPEHASPSHAGTAYAFPSVPPTVPSPQTLSRTSPPGSGSVSGSARLPEARSTEPSVTSSSASSLRGLPPPLPPKKNRPSVAPAVPAPAPAPAEQATPAPEAAAAAAQDDSSETAAAAAQLASDDDGSSEEDDALSVLDDGHSESPTAQAVEAGSAASTAAAHKDNKAAASTAAGDPEFTAVVPVPAADTDAAAKPAGDEKGGVGGSTLQVHLQPLSPDAATDEGVSKASTPVAGGEAE